MKDSKMTDLFLDAMNILALNGFVKNIAKIRETCKEASQLEILNERFQAEYDEWFTLNYNALKIQKWWSKIVEECRECGNYFRPNGISVCNDCQNEYDREENIMFARELYRYPLLMVGINRRY